METKLTAVVGIREVTWGSSSFLINHSPFYFRGFGRHEDSDFRGKGLDLPLVARHGTTSRPI
jgi:beta-glucuronidase